MKSYAHMCRDEHTEIGHDDSGEDERCPVCRERDRAEYYLAVIEFYARCSADAFTADGGYMARAVLARRIEARRVETSSAPCEAREPDGKAGAP